MAKLMSRDALERFFGYNSHFFLSFQSNLVRYAIGDFVYYDSEEVESILTPKAKKHFREYQERNPLQFVEYNFEENAERGKESKMH